MKNIEFVVDKNILEQREKQKKKEQKKESICKVDKLREHKIKQSHIECQGTHTKIAKRTRWKREKNADTHQQI